MKILKEGVIQINPDGSLLVMNFVTEGTPEELIEEVRSRLRMALAKTFTAPQVIPSSPPSEGRLH